jgi:hypothetical protein
MMSAGVCGLAADTKVETPEGATTIRSVVGKAIAVFTREASGRVRFRMMKNVRKIADQQPVLKVIVETGQGFRITPDQVLFKKGMIECRAAALQVGDALEPAFTYPEGYRFKDDHDGHDRASGASLRVSSIEPAGTADIYSLAVHHTGCFFVTAGVLCKAEGT